MRLQVNDIRAAIKGKDELIFLYHKKTDKLYLSEGLRALLEEGEEVGKYWKSSRLWHRIDHCEQERLVNMIRHEIWYDKSVLTQVTLLNAQGDHVLFELELWAIWGEKENIDIEGVKGRMKRV